jgi:uncharacterized protein (TIGR02231 family)
MTASLAFHHEPYRRQGDIPMLKPFLHPRLCVPYACLFMFVALFTAQAVQADITAVTLFPDSAIIEEQGEIPVTSAKNHRTGVIFLPGQADPASLAFHPSEGVVLTDISPESVVSIDSEQLAALKTRLENLEARKSRLEARKKGLEATIAFWQSRQKAEQGSLDQLKELAAVMGKEIEAAMLGVDTASNELQTLSKEIEKITREITAIQGKTTTNWKITLGFSAGNEQTIPCVWSYAVTACGWKPIYRLEAVSAENKVRFAWQARVHQGTGMDWNNVRLSLATGRTHMKPTPPAIRPWILQPAQPAGIDSKAFMLEETAAPRAVMQRAAMPANEAVEERKGTFSTWELGLRTIAAGEDIRVRVKDALWPAAFRYILRPSVSGFGFLHTEITLDSSLDLPRGEAMFLVDGAFLRKQGFSFSGDKLDLFFGPDPLITAKTVLKNKKSGNSGVFTQKKTWIWDWNLIVANDKTIAIQAVIEEPRPLSRDEDIVLSVTASPAPQEAKDDQPEIMTWALDLAPGIEQTISMHVEAKAPEDMDVDPGWRW